MTIKSQMCQFFFQQQKKVKKILFLLCAFIYLAGVVQVFFSENESIGRSSI